MPERLFFTLPVRINAQNRTGTRSISPHALPDTSCAFHDVSRVALSGATNLLND
ncbi:hypothetical protein PGB90_009661 [Kerria lacca]